MNTTNTHEAQVNYLIPVALGLFNLPIFYYNKSNLTFQEKMGEETR
jgi:hypothetical protein